MSGKGMLAKNKKLCELRAEKEGEIKERERNRWKWEGEESGEIRGGEDGGPRE